MAKAKTLPTFKPWHPFHAQLTPPLGFYDPVLDANLGAANRGLADTKSDAGTQQARLTSDYALGQQQINTNAARQTADIATQRQQGTDDYHRNLSDLQQAYSRLGVTQGQQQNAMGVLQGGAALQAAEKRAANQVHDQAPLDTGFARLTQGLDSAQTRVGEDQQMQLGQSGLSTLRGLQDLVTQVTRAGRENTAFGLDTSAAKAAQAAANGWSPYAGRRPNESGTGGNARRVVVRGGVAYTIDPSGRIISKRKAG